MDYGEMSTDELIEDFENTTTEYLRSKAASKSCAELAHRFCALSDELKHRCEGFRLAMAVLDAQDKLKTARVAGTQGFPFLGLEAAIVSARAALDAHLAARGERTSP